MNFHARPHRRSKSMFFHADRLALVGVEHLALVLQLVLEHPVPVVEEHLVVGDDDGRIGDGGDGKGVGERGGGSPNF